MKNIRLNQDRKRNMADRPPFFSHTADNDGMIMQMAQWNYAMVEDTKECI